MNDIYTPPQQALETIEERRVDTKLLVKASKFLGGLLPAGCFGVNGDNNVPPAILARYVPRATSEDTIYADISGAAGLNPYWASYLGDRYTVRNAEKVSTIRPTVMWAGGQRTKQWIVAPENRVGGIRYMQTMFGCTSAEYQQGIREIVFNEKGSNDIVNNTFDLTAWYRLQAARFGYESGNLAPFYYPALMGLVAVYGVLYEDFDGGPSSSNGDLAMFIRQVVYPAICLVGENLGVKPVIVQLPYQKGMNETNLAFLSPEEAKLVKERGSRALLSARMDSR